MKRLRVVEYTDMGGGGEGVSVTTATLSFTARATDDAQNAEEHPQIINLAGGASPI